MYGGTVLGCTVWSAINETRVDHLAIIEALIDAGADIDRGGYSTGPKKLVILEGSAHAQFVFETAQGERLMREILRFLSQR